MLSLNIKFMGIGIVGYSLLISMAHCAEIPVPPPMTPLIVATNDAGVLRAGIKLVSDVSGYLAVLVDDKVRLSLVDLPMIGTTNLQGIVFSTSKDGRSFTLKSDEKEVILEAADFAGWAAKLPRKNQARINVDQPRKVIDLTTPPENKEVVTIRFADQSTAEIGPASSTRFDLFLDQSYYFAATGHVYTETVDGKKANLNPYMPPMTGGPLVKVVDKTGASRFKRFSPEIQCIITGDLTKEVVMRAEEKQIKLAPDQVTQVTFTNGTSLELTLQSSTHTLRWKIEKGYVGFSVVGMECWHARGLTDQVGGLQWDGGSSSIDLWNYTSKQVAPPNHYILVDLTRGLFVCASPQAVFQYAQSFDCETFTTSATGGPVLLYNAKTQQTARIDLGNVILNAGVAIAGDFSGGGNRSGGEGKRTIAFTGESGATLSFQGALGSASVPLDSDKTIRGGNAGELSISYSSSGEITLTSNSGDYVVQPKALPNWSIDLREGETVTILLNLQQGLFMARNTADSGNGVKINTPEGFSPSLGPQAAVTFMVDSTRGLLTGSSGLVAFFEGAGASANQTLGVAPGTSSPTPTGRGMPSGFSTPGTQDDASRIPQQDVSIFRTP